MLSIKRCLTNSRLAKIIDLCFEKSIVLDGIRQKNNRTQKLDIEELRKKSDIDKEK